MKTRDLNYLLQLEAAAAHARKLSLVVARLQTKYPGKIREIHDALEIDGNVPGLLQEVMKELENLNLEMGGEYPKNDVTKC